MKELELRKKELLGEIKEWNWFLTKTSPTSDEQDYFSECIFKARLEIDCIDIQIHKINERDRKIEEILKEKERIMEKRIRDNCKITIK